MERNYLTPSTKNYLPGVAFGRHCSVTMGHYPSLPVTILTILTIHEYSSPAIRAGWQGPNGQTASNRGLMLAPC